MREQVPLARLLTRQQAVHARTVLDYVAAHSLPAPGGRGAPGGAHAHPADRAGTGDVTCQDLAGWLPNDAEQMVQRLVAADWLRLPRTVAEVTASRSENPTAVTDTS